MRERDYQVVVEGELGEVVARTFEGMHVAPVAGRTVIVGPVRDQAELHAVLRRIGDLGLNLVSVAALPQHERGNGGRRPE